MRNAKHGLWLLLSACVIVLDQASKQWALLLPYGYFKSIMGHFFGWRLVFNEGAAFSMGQNLPGGSITLSLLGLTFTVCLIIWLWTLPRERWTFSLALSLVIGGSLGNLYDRLFLGYVIDFIDMGIGAWRWPTFNVADIFISLGIGWMCWKISGQKKAERIL